jgi:integrase
MEFLMPRQKPKKPYADFPLFAHQNGQWAKKIRGRLHYFGRWKDSQQALSLYLDQRDDLHAGRKPRLKTDGMTVRELCNRFLTAKQDRVNEGALGQRAFADYISICRLVLAELGSTRIVDDLDADDFTAFRRTIGQRRKTPTSIGSVIQRARTVFRFAFEMGYIKESLNFGTEFQMPSQRSIRIARAASGPRMFEAAEIRQLLSSTSPTMKALILLGINCGFGQSDCSHLPCSALQLDEGWLQYPRPKTGIDRRCPLWPQTIAAIRASVEQRRVAEDGRTEELVFRTRFGRPLVRISDSGRPIDAVSLEFRKLLKSQHLYRPKLGFYALRHTFETIAGESRDQVAVGQIMGHVDNSMAGLYRERITDDRLLSVAATVEQWLFPANGQGDRTDG